MVVLVLWPMVLEARSAGFPRPGSLILALAEELGRDNHGRLESME